MTTKSTYKELKLSLENEISNEFYNFYKDYNFYQELPVILSSVHNLLIAEFRDLNYYLPTKSYGAHFNADGSRRLILAIDSLMQLKGLFEVDNVPLKINDYILDICQKCSKFLMPRYGSEIPKDMAKVDIYSDDPIFEPINVVKQPRIRYVKSELKMIGTGSYANVYSFKDSFYGKKFALKRAKNDLTTKELERFKKEFSFLCDMNSPYVVDVYCFDDKNNEFFLEYLDTTIEKYYEANNDKISLKKRKSYIFQFLRGLKAIHRKNLLHRDISPRNLMLKIYDDTEVVKITDFGLVKENKSDLTSLDSDVKGSFNDPRLKIDGFSNYCFSHEIYAATLMCVFLLTGKDKAFSSIKNAQIAQILKKGTNENIELRYHSIDELEADISKIDNI